MLPLLIIFAALTVFFLVWLLFSALLRNKLIVRSRLKKLAETEKSESSREKRRRGRKKDLSPSQQKRLAKLEGQLYAANIKLRAQEFITIWLIACILIPGLLAFFGAPLITALGALILTAAAPIAAVKLIRRRRLSRLDGQLVDALSVMCSALRAGFSFQMAMESIAKEMPDPIAREFGRVARECTLGMPMDISFAHLIQRTHNKDLEMICWAVLIQRQVGGNLAEVLDNVAETIRQRIKIKGDMKTLTASGTVSGYIIGLLPVFILLILMLVSPNYVEMFFSTELGRKLLIIALALELVGFYFVRKIITIKL